MSVEKEKERKKGEIPFLYVETMGVNGVDTPDPHIFSAESMMRHLLTAGNQSVSAEKTPFM